MKRRRWYTAELVERTGEMVTFWCRDDVDPLRPEWVSVGVIVDVYPRIRLVKLEGDRRVLPFDVILDFA